MEPLATVQDVEANYRALRGQEITNAESWLRTASGQLRIRFPDIDGRVSFDPALADLVRGIVAMAVIRVLRGSDRTDASTVTDIFFTTAELAALVEASGSVSESAFTITPYGAPGVVASDALWWTTVT